MGRRSPNAGIGGAPSRRARWWPRPSCPSPPAHPDATQPLDQALVTGISTALNYSFAALVQDSIEALALRGAGRIDPAKVDRHT